jgi:hypothetical protein
MTQHIALFYPLLILIIGSIGLFFYVAYSKAWLDNILTIFKKAPEEKDKGKLKEKEIEEEKIEGIGKDKFGITTIYPIADDTLPEQIWYAKWDDRATKTLGKEQTDPLDSSFRLGSAGSTFEVTISGNGTATVNGSSPRMYVFGKWTNVEITVYVKYSSPDDLDSVSIHGRSNHHKDCGFGGYTVRFGGIEDDDGGKSWIKKEPLHGIYSDRMGTVDYSLPVNEWIGLKAVVRNIVDDEDGQSKVSIEGYVDDTTGGRIVNDDDISNGEGEAVGQWKKIVQAIDDGTWPGMGEEKEDKEIMKECISKGDNIPHDIYKPFSKTTEAIWVRTNDAQEVKYKWFSVREIEE